VIGSVLPRGRDVGGLLRYLFREGRAGEHGLAADHAAPRLIGAWDTDLARLEPARTDSGRRDVRPLARTLEAPLRFANIDPATKPVYHLAIAAAKDPRTGRLLDRPLSDEQWADVAAEYLHQIGLAQRGDEQAVRWVAVRHADDHIDVVATLARQDGRRVFPRNDHYRTREASLTVEARYHLIGTSPSGRTGSRPPSRAETRKHEALASARRSQGSLAPPAPDRLVLRQIVRAAAGSSTGWEDFAQRLYRQGVHLRARMSERNPGQITGYAVALPDRYDTGQTIWFGGGKLAPDLTLPQLQRRWQGHEAPAEQARSERDGRAGTPQSADRAAAPAPDADRFGLTPQDRQLLWQSAQQAAQRAMAHITAVLDAGADPRLGGDAAWAAADLLAVVAQLTEGRRGGPYTDAARTFEQAGRELHKRPAPRTPTGRRWTVPASAALSAIRIVVPSEQRQLLILAHQLIALAEAVERLRKAQARAAQAAAARRAAEQLLAMHPPAVAPRPFVGSPWARPSPSRDPPRDRPAVAAEASIAADAAVEGGSSIVVRTTLARGATSPCPYPLRHASWGSTTLGSPSSAGSAEHAMAVTPSPSTATGKGPDSDFGLGFAADRLDDFKGGTKRPTGSSPRSVAAHLRQGARRRPVQRLARGDLCLAKHCAVHPVSSSTRPSARPADRRSRAARSARPARSRDRTRRHRRPWRCPPSPWAGRTAPRTTPARPVPAPGSAGRRTARPGCRGPPVRAAARSRGRGRPGCRPITAGPVPPA
jgi:hypothetical protein